MSVEQAPLITIPEPLSRKGLKLVERTTTGKEDTQMIYQESLILIAQIIGLPITKIPEIQNELQQAIENSKNDSRGKLKRDLFSGPDNPPEKEIIKTLERVEPAFSRDSRLIKDLCLEHGLEDPFFEYGDYFLRLRILKAAGLKEQEKKAIAPLLLACCLESAADQAMLQPLLLWLKTRLRPGTNTSFSITQKEEYFKILIGKSEAYLDFATRLNQIIPSYGQKVYGENSQELTELLKTWITSKFFDTRSYSPPMIDAQAKNVPSKLFEIAKFPLLNSQQA